jgi:peptidase inhibitor family I36
MTRTSAMAVLAGALVLAASPNAWAQRWGRADFPRDGVCFFEDANYRGDYFCVRAGEDLSFIPRDMNDRISSMRIFGRVEVTVFTDARFDGRSERLRNDVPNFKRGGFNDAISSLRVRRPEGDRGFFGGRREDPDRIVRRAYQDILKRDPDTEGLRLYRSRVIDDGWTEAQVRDALRKSPEFREMNTMTPDKAREIVRRAYLAVFKREPDSGSRGYVDRVLRDHWSQQDVERELRKSPEYRKR